MPPNILTTGKLFRASRHPATGYSTNWYNQVLRNAFYQNHNLSISGGNTQDKYALSASYQTNDGIIIFNNYTRYTVRLNNEFSPTAFLKIGTTASFANQTAQNVPTGTITEDAYRAAPLVPAMINGKFGNTSQYQNVGNPVLDAQNTNDLSHSNKLQGNVFVEIKPVHSLALRSTFNEEAVFGDDRAYTYEHPNDTTFFTTNGGYTRRNQKHTECVQLEILLLGLEQYRHIHPGLSERASSACWLVPKHRRTTIPAGPPIGIAYRPIPSEWYLQDGDQNFQFNNSSITKYTTNSYLGRIIYSYDGRFLFTGNFRADGSSVFNAQNRWGYFPGASVGWVLTRENFMQGQKIFDYLKIRGSWGELGNSNIPADGAVKTALSNIPYFFNSGIGSTTAVGTTGAIFPQIKDLNLKWEVTKEADLGFDYSALAGRLTGEFDVYDKKATQALIYVYVAGTFGSQAKPQQHDCARICAGQCCHDRQ